MSFNKKNIIRRGQTIYTWGIGSIIDVADGIPQGKALDLVQSSTIEYFDAKIQGSTKLITAFLIFIFFM